MQPTRAPLSVRLPADVEGRLRAHAQEAGKAVNQVVAQAVRELLDREENTDPAPHSRSQN